MDKIHGEISWVYGDTVDGRKILLVDGKHAIIPFPVFHRNPNSYPAWCSSKTLHPWDHIGYLHSLLGDSSHLISKIKPH